MKDSTNKKTKIIVDVERMKYPFTGLYYYCRDLALNLEKYHTDTFEFYFFSYPGVNLPKHLKKIVRNFFDKYHLTKPKQYKLWHSTWQDTKYVPKNNMKFVYTIHDLNFLYTDKSAIKKKELLQAVQNKIDKADAITVISHFVKEDVIKNLDPKGKKIHVIHNGVDFEEFPKFDSPDYRPKKKFLFTVGTVLYKKHFHILPSLLVGNDYELIIAGIHSNKNYVSQIEKEIKKHEVSGRVNLVGTITAEEKYWYMKNAEAFLFPSISEGFGLPPIEAMRLGKPTFLSTHTSLPEIGGEHAYYFDTFEPESMRKVLKEGITDYYENNKKDAIVKWSEQFNWKKAATEYVEIYKKAIAGEANFEESTFTATKIPLTAIIPTLNEESNIKAAIKTVEFADEIIVIDSYSTDNTVSLAKKQGAKVIQRKFDGFSTQKNFAINEASHDWVFILDADERISKLLKNEIIQTLENIPDNDAYWIPRKNYIGKKLVRYSGWQNDKVIRLFNRKKSQYDSKIVHEEIICTGKVSFFKNPLIHYSFENYLDIKNRTHFYSKLKAKELFEKGEKPNVLQFIFKPLYRFLKHYIIGLGFLDGITGIHISYVSSLGVYYRYKELKKLYRN